jgi:predicted DNA-binding protein YlxM (UPF0122 family)
MWKLYNTQIHKGESIRVFPLSNWTEKDIWQYIKRENIEIVSLYFAEERPVIERDGSIILVDDDRLKLRKGEKILHKSVRFRTLGCYPLTGGVYSTANTLDGIIDETLSAVTSERTSRVIDKDGGAASMEKNMQVSLLLDFYGQLLSESGREMTDYYYNDDLSLAEIAEQTGITRQGVRDRIKRCEKQLFSFEEKLGLLKRFQQLEDGLTQISAAAKTIYSSSDDPDVKRIARSIEQNADSLKE